ncbi:MAG TPA: hypothetical protein VE977_01385 [Pyrinomonadaceae bacterium]|nr:hypothetical protein [Pyrinomonadaceae bacterium]
MNETSQKNKRRPFHITVAAAGNEGMNIDNDLRMLRTALIYGDHVKLCSFTTAGVLFQFSVWSNPLKDFVAWGEENIIDIIPDEQKRNDLIRGIESYRKAMKKKHRTRDDLLTRMRIERDLARTRDEMKQRYPAITREADIRGIQAAMKSKLLELYTFKSLDFKGLAKKHFAGQDTGNSSDVVDEFVNLISDAVEDRSTYPLFDDTSGNLAKLAMRDGAISFSGIRLQQANHCALADNLLRRLPDFSETPIEELLDIKSELSSSLDRFRSGVSTYATDIKCAPWDKDFAAAADEIFIQKVKPAINEIDERVAATPSIKECLLRGVLNNKSLSGGGIGFLIDQHSALPKYIATALGYALPTALSMWDEFKNRFRKQKEAQNHDLYFYYELRDKVEE